MARKSNILLTLFGLILPVAYAADGEEAAPEAPAEATAEAPAADAPAAEAPAGDAPEVEEKAKEKEKKVLDLNQVDLEQVEDEWDSTPKQQAVEQGNRLKINDIVQPKADYSYASFGKSDPFEMPAFKGFENPDAPAGEGGNGLSLTTPEGKEIKMSSPLQSYPLSELKVKGVWQLENGEMRSMIVTPRNEGVVAKVDDPISSGKVLSIARDAITVRLYKIRKDGTREYEDQRVSFGAVSQVTRGVIKLEPGKDAQFLTPENPASADGAAAAAAGPGAAVDKAANALTDMTKTMSDAAKQAQINAQLGKPAVPPPGTPAAGAAAGAGAQAVPGALPNQVPAPAQGVVPVNNPVQPQKSNRPGS